MAESKAHHRAPNPLASVDVDAIHRRLLRPYPLLSPAEANERKSLGSTPNLAEKKRKLEDYLDPVLLSTISAEIGHDRKQIVKRKKNFEKIDPIVKFNWPVHQLEPLIEISNRDSDSIRAGEDEEGESCSPFRRFEQMAWKWFWGEG